MRVCVVVATYNRRASLRRLLDSLFAQELEAAEMEIVVVDDGSTDGTRAMVEAMQAPCPLRVISQPNAGQAHARNTGWRAGTGRVVLFLDDDLECPPTLLAEHLAAHRADDGYDDRRVVVGGLTASRPARPSMAWELRDRQLAEWTQRLDRSPTLVWPDDAYVFTNCSVSRSMLERVGGYDEAFYRALEDHDLGLRLWAEGARFVYAPGAVVEHTHHKSSREAVRDEQRYGRAEVLLGRKHPSVLQHGSLGGIAAMSWWKRTAVRALARRPTAARLLLGTPVALIERAPAGWPVRRLGMRLLSLWMRASRVGAAVEALGGWPAYDARFSRRLAVLMYHRVGPPRAGTYPDLTVSGAAFARQTAALERGGYRPVSPTEYLAWRLGQAELPERAVMITFDDGYADIADHALPVLSRHGFASCVFVVTGRFGETNTWDEELGSEPLRLLGLPQTMDAQQQGAELGGHSRTHPNLTAVPAERLREEVDGCRTDLERLTGRPPVAFAYPWGEADEREVAEVRKAFPLAFSTAEGLNYLGTDAHMLRRTMVLPGDSGRAVLLRARLGYSPRDVLLRWRGAATRPVKRLVRRFSSAATGSEPSPKP